MLLVDLAAASRAVAAIPGRTAKLELLASSLLAAGPTEVLLVVAYLSGVLPQRRPGVGYAALRDLPPPAELPSLLVVEVDAAFEQLTAVSGAGSAARRQQLVHDLFARATQDEQRLLVGLIGGELRQGAQAGLLTDAVARAAGVPLADVRRALTLSGSLPAVAAAALTEGREGLGRFRLQVGRALSPMLAQPGSDLADALAGTAPSAVEVKLDGVRVQVHRDRADVAVFTRTLDEITARVPELVQAALALPVTTLVLDGEAIALRPDGRPHTFQVTAARAATRSGGGTVPLTPYYFDLLHLDGADLLDEPLHVRAEALAGVVPERQRAPRVVTDDLETAQGFFAAALAGGHEGVVVKALSAPYEAGRRGAAGRR